MFCPNCGKDVPVGAKFCENCGTAAQAPGPQYAQAPPQGQYQAPPPQYPAPAPAYGQPAPYGAPPYGAVPMKSTGVATVLALVLGLIGFAGIGHIYIGKLTEGIVFLIVGWVLLVVGILTFGIGLILWLIFVIWQTYDAYNKANRYNAAVQQTGRAPW